MRHINYNHLLYFWTVAKEGSIVKASGVLHLTPQTISAQIKLLEDSLGFQLLEKAGRGIKVTEQGQAVRAYADEIFTLGLELSRRMRNQSNEGSSVLKVGLVETLPKVAVESFLRPVMETEPVVRLVCHEGKLEELVSELAIHALDLVLSDRSMPSSSNLKVYNHLLGVSPVAIYAPVSKIDLYRDNLPSSLDGAPMLLPLENSPLRHAADQWFFANNIIPEIVAECSDSALIKALASTERGLFVAPANLAVDIERITHCTMLTVLDEFTEHYYAISAERKISHPSVNLIASKARSALS